MSEKPYRPKPPLSHTQLVALVADQTRYRLSVGEVEGLVIDVTPSGAKSFLLRYRHPVTGKRLNLALGKFPDLGLSDARQRARDIRQLIASGIDPQEHREKLKQEHEEQQRIQQHEQQRQAQTLKAASDAWLDVKASEVSSDFLTDIERSLELHVYPRLGSMPISDISAPVVVEALRPLEAAGKLETVKRVTGRLNEIMTYAVNTGLAHHNPLSGLREAFRKPKAQNLPSIPPSELPQLLADIQKASIRISTRNLLLFHLHTVVRPAEVSGARWDEIDLKARLWRIPAERMKKKRGHTIPLTDAALKVLERQKPLSEHSEYVFPGDRDDTQPTHTQTGSMALKRMGYGGRLVAHGFRSIFSTWAHDDTRSFDYHAVETCLAHVPDSKTAAAYNRGSRLEKRRAIMEAWSDFIGQSYIKAMASQMGLSVVEG